jgi:CRP-like cAMP-binding protein
MLKLLMKKEDVMYKTFYVENKNSNTDDPMYKTFYKAKNNSPPASSRTVYKDKKKFQTTKSMVNLGKYKLKGMHKKESTREAIHFSSNLMLIPTQDADNFEKPDEDKIFEELIEVLQKDPDKRTPADIHVIITYLHETELMNKFKRDKEVSENSYNNVMYMCSTHMKLKKLEKGEILFKIDDIGDKFYVILRGTIQVLKPVEGQRIKMTPHEYFDHLMVLMSKEEKHLMSRTLRENLEVLFIRDSVEFEKVLSFIVRYIFMIQESKFSNLDEVEKFVNLYKKSLKDFNVNTKELEELKENIRTHSKEIMGRFNDPDEAWLFYLKQKLNITEDESSLYLKYIHFLFRDKEKKEVTLIDYQNFISLNSGQFFGDFALDNDNKKRTATIKAEEDCYLGYISNAIYEEYIQAEKQKLKNKEVTFLCENFFLNPIKLITFEKKYFSHFAAHEYNRGYEIFKEGQPSEKLIMIKEGLIELTFNGTLLELHSLIKLLIGRFYHLLNTQKSLAFVDKTDLLFFKEYLNDELITNLRNKSQKFIRDINVKKTINISILGMKDICGIEEIFLGNLNRFLKATVHSERVKVYKLGVDKMKYIFENEIPCIFPYIKISIAKLVTMIKRLYHVKQTLIQLSFKESKIFDRLNEIQNKEKFAIAEHEPEPVRIINKIMSKNSSLSSNNFSNLISTFNLNNNLQKISNKNLKTYNNETISILDSPRVKYQGSPIINADTISNIIKTRNQVTKILDINSFNSNLISNEASDTEPAQEKVPLLSERENQSNKDNVIVEYKNKKVEKLNFDSVIIEKIKTSMNEFQNQSVISSINQKYEIKNKINFSNSSNKGEVFITGSTIFQNFKKGNKSGRYTKENTSKNLTNSQIINKQANPKISSFHMIDFNSDGLKLNTKDKDQSMLIDKNFVVQDTSLQRFSQPDFSPLPIIPYVNKFKSEFEHRLKKSKKNHESVDNLVNITNMLLSKPDNEQDPSNKFSVKSVKKFREKNRMEGYKKFVSSNNAMLKMKIAKFDSSSHFTMDSKESVSTSGSYSHRKIFSFIN